MLTTKTAPTLNPLRDTIIKAYRMDETESLHILLPQAAFSPGSRKHITDIATQLVQETRAYKKRQGKIDSLLHQYDLSTEEGIALMCLAEALLRIPDNYTLDRLISEGPTQIDTSTPFEQLIIPLKVKSIRDPSKKNADNLHNDLNTIITNKGFTEIFLHPHTSLLDETYGYKLKGEFIIVQYILYVIYIFF